MSKQNRWSVVLGTLLLFIVLVAACGTAPATRTDAPADTPPELSGEIIVFAAASLTEAYTELSDTFEETHPGTTVTLNLAGSQQLAQQLGQGAPADVFASANQKQMDVAIAAGRIVSETQQDFASNRLVVIVSNDSPVAVTSLPDLTTPGLKLILAAQEVPVGNYSHTFLQKAATEEHLGADYDEAVLANVVSHEQTVKAVLTKVMLGEGDAGIVYTSDITEDAADQVTTVAIPDELNVIATYPIAAVQDAPNPAGAAAFVEYVLSAKGQAILQRHGFLPAR